MLRCLVVAVVVACSACGSSEPPLASGNAAAQRTITPRSNLPQAIQPLLPRRGIYAAGGGLMSSAWRVVVDHDQRSIYGGETAASNAPSFGAMDKSGTKKLTSAQLSLLQQLANDAWTAPRHPPTDPTADYDEIFVVVEGDDAFYLQGFGPIHEPAAKRAILELRAAAGLGI